MSSETYTFFADESGQSGIKKIRSAGVGGASRYMTLGGVLIPDSAHAKIKGAIADLQSEFGRGDLHCSKLNHNQIVRFSKELSTHRVRLFGVLSLKETLGSYSDDIQGSDKKYYNKCAQYLLERLAHAMEELGIPEGDVRIVFEEGNFDYTALRGLIAKCRKSPRYQPTKRLRLINPYAITTAPKAKELLLQTGDLVAHALYRCVDDGPSTFGVQETRYTHELRTKFFSDKTTKKVVGAGIHAVHKISDIKPTSEVYEFLDNLRSL